MSESSDSGWDLLRGRLAEAPEWKMNLHSDGIAVVDSQFKTIAVMPTYMSEDRGKAIACFIASAPRMFNILWRAESMASSMVRAFPELSQAQDHIMYGDLTVRKGDAVDFLKEVRFAIAEALRIDLSGDITDDSLNSAEVFLFETAPGSETELFPDREI
jgi:hypothetical protein